MQGRSSGLQMCTRVCLHSLGPAGSYGAPVGPPCWQCGLSYAWRKLKPGGRSRWLTTRAQEETFSSIYPVAKTIMQKDKASRRLPGCSGFQCALLLIAARLSSPPPSPFRWLLSGSSDHGHAGIFSVPCVHGFQAHVLNHLTKADGPSIEARHSMAHTKVRDTHFSCVLESW